MSGVSRLAALAAAGALALAPAGCGEEDEPTSATPEVATTTTSETSPERSPDGDGEAPPENEEPTEQIERPLTPADVAKAVLTRSGSPEQGCEELVTERFVREAYGGRAGCLAAREAGGLARSLERTSFNESRADRVTGTAVPIGGPYDGIEVEVELVPDPADEGGWLVDSLVADVPAGP